MILQFLGKRIRAYAWSYRDGDTVKSVTILEIPPVDSPQSAVKVAIAAEAKKSKMAPEPLPGYDNPFFD